MDAEPKALRISTILTIAFVLMGVIAGSFLFLMGQHANRAGTLPSGNDLDAVVTRPMAAPSKIDEATLARIYELLPIVMSSPAPEIRRNAGESMLQIGGLAVPFLLNALHTIGSGSDGFQSLPARQGLTNADAVLRRLRLTLTPDSPADPVPPDPSPAWFPRRAKSWFAWWDGYISLHPELR